MALAWLVVSMLTASGVAAAQRPSPTFTHEIAPIVFRHCVTCHHPGPNGAFSLLTYADVRPRAKSIAAVTKSRYMPPWKPEHGYGDPLLGARALTDQEIETIQAWADGGAPQGNPAELPNTPDWTDGWRLGTPDLIVQMPDAFYVPASGPDIFRIFVFPIPASAARYVKAIEFQPGTRAVHHANIRLDETRLSRQLDDKDPAPGYDGLLARTAHFPDGHFFGWTPGQLTPPSDDLAWRLNPGTDMVLQLHLRPTGAAERVQATIGLYFSAGPPRLTPLMLRLGKQSIDIAAGQRDYETTDSYVLPVDVDVHGVQPHAHYRAKEVTGFATLPDGTTKGLIHIPDWDFDWQDTYRYVKAFTLPKGTRVTMRYAYDNSAGNRRNPQLPPERVHWGQNSSDEMGDLWIQVVPRSASDLDALARDLRQKVFREDIVGYETMLQRSPDDVSLHDDVALLYLAIGRFDSAIAHFGESARVSPMLPVTHFNLGTALVTAGRIDDAIAQFRQALQLDAAYAQAHNNLGSLLLVKRDLDEAAAHFRRAIEIDSRYAEAHNNLGKLLTYGGRIDEALDHLTTALSIRADYPEAHYNLATALLAERRTDEAIGHYRTAVSMMPEWPPALSDLAWVLATSPDARVRDARQAVAFAERAVSVTNRRDAASLDAAAAAYAAGGRYDEAVSSAQAALDIVTRRGLSVFAADLSDRIALYRQQRTYIDVQAKGPVRP